ncbi:threonine synthase [Halorubrum sp. JWXQ-INN 858]|uniref:threonine synthase n=1 Tax=Halorubrum sp. JWXQ-INN 858 TaxID=2690782 RepID=UPI00135C97F4|nr:threonine synthase [Halorubrum sp. JWXQ-INN 858]MWV65770.1 threonine synthase [Halorubrum sp. JWXQ-INN 858]
MSLSTVRRLTCTRCGAGYDPDREIYTCPEHEGVAGVLEVEYDYAAIDDAFDADLDGVIPSQWKYAAFLPVADDAEPVTLGEGGTDLLDAPRLSDRLGVETLIKDDGRNPTGCFKDRASSIAATKAKHRGRDVVTCASTGNAAASLAGYAARGGLDCRIFVPSDAPAGKLTQPLVYGADVLAVEGTYDEAYDLSVAVTESYGWYNRNAAINPFLIEGKRTVGHELAEQTHVRGRVPDWVVFSMGDGCTIAGAWKGFREFADLGYVDGTPRMLGVQAEGAAAIHGAVQRHGRGGEGTDDGEDGADGEDDSADGDDTAETLADSIAVGRPRNAYKARRAIEESGGASVVVSDEEILRAETLLGSTEGIYAEPAGAAPVAGVRQARRQGIIGPDEQVVVTVTGFGLKDGESARRATGGLDRIAPDISEVERRYGPAESGTSVL